MLDHKELCEATGEKKASETVVFTYTAKCFTLGDAYLKQDMDTVLFPDLNLKYIFFLIKTKTADSTLLR